MAHIPDETMDPRDFGAPPPELPQGTFIIPTFPTLQDDETMMREQRAAGPHHYLDFQVLPDELKTVVIEYWPKIWMGKSEYDGNYVTTVHGVLEYANQYKKDRKPQQQARTAARDQRAVHADAYKAWEADCAARKQWIEEKCAQWRKRVLERSIALAQWDTYVADARTEYQTAKNTPAPPRP